MRPGRVLLAFAVAGATVPGPLARAQTADSKEIFRLLKAVPHGSFAAAARQPPVTLFNLKTREALPVLDAPPDAETWSRLVRCHFTGTVAWVDPRLAREAVAAARRFGANRVEILSGYRDPKYNRLLRKKGRDVARQSRHTRGQAVDLRLPGVGTTRLRDWLLARRAFGVGVYPDSGFVHLDVGPPRRWTGR